MATTKEILGEVGEARRRKIAYLECGNTAFDPENSANDWVAGIVAYAGRASRKEMRGDGWKNTYCFRDMMVIVAALAVAAIESCDKVMAQSRKDGD